MDDFDAARKAFWDGLRQQVAECDVQATYSHQDGDTIEVVAVDADVLIRAIDAARKD